MDYKSLLNEEQIKPVMDTEGAVLVLAGAGSGKTRVLTFRIAYLLDILQVHPSNILAITFTNKASKEMVERIENVTQVSGMWVSTFHSFCAKILRFEIEKIGGYTSNFSIYTTADSLKVIGNLLKNYGINDAEVKKNVKGHISSAKNLGYSAEKYCNGLDDQNKDIIYKVFIDYDKELQKSNALDFDDLLLKVVKLFVDFPEILDKYQTKFKYIHVDEFQDTNKIQLILVRLLAKKHGNIFVVGDDDQSIYGWRGAEVENILNFKKYFPDVKIYKLEQNYRSTDNIIKCANKIITKNRSRMGKELWTSSGSGVGVVYRANYNEKEEADYVLREIVGLVDHNGFGYNDFAILVRANSLTRTFEEKMNLYGIKYRLFGGFKFYERKEVMDMVAYLRLIANPRDLTAITRIINFPKRGIGETAVDKLIEYCNLSGTEFIDALIDIEENPNFTLAFKKKFVQFRSLIMDLFASKNKYEFYDYIDYIAGKVDFYSAYDMDKPEERDKLENIDSFITSVKEYCKDNEGATLEEYLQSLSLISDTDDEYDGERVTIATIHSVKGLEFKCVFIVGCEEGIFPSARSKNNITELEEERRCMYVAITRAKERLYVTSASSRFRFGKYENNLVSRFVEEAGLIKPSETLSKDKTKYQAVGFKSEIRAEPKLNNIEKDISKFHVGCLVKHTKYGIGVVETLNNEVANIKFEVLGVKTFNLRLAPLEILK